MTNVNPSPNLAAHGSTTATTFCDFCALLKKMEPTKEQLQTGLRENQRGRAHREKALVRVDDKKELTNPPRIQEKEFKEPEPEEKRLLVWGMPLRTYRMSYLYHNLHTPSCESLAARGTRPRLSSF
jgi:hypothetical protein